MDSGEKFHLIIATILFVGLFSFIALPPPLTGVSNALQSFGYFTYEVARFTGTATDEGMCVLADLWNMGGLTAEYHLVNSDELLNTSCARLSEEKIAITPKDERIYGNELKGIIQDVYIENRLTLLKLFYVSYALLGLVVGAVVADIWMSVGNKKSTATALGITVIMTIAVVMPLFRAGLIWPYLEVFMQLTPGNTLLGDAIFMTLSLSLVWFIFAQIIRGYNVTKASYKKFTAVSKAAELDLRRGEKVLDAAEGKLE